MVRLQALGLGHVADLAKQCSEEAVGVMRKIMLDPKAPHSARIAASIGLLDRGWGRPAQQTEMKHQPHVDASAANDLKGRKSVLELYHSINSVCAQKVRIALEEKGQKAEDRIMTLRGDQYDLAYLELNPNGVVPTLVHDGKPVIESSLILYYIEDAFPEPSLMPKDPYLRHRVPMYNKLIDEYVHNSCTILTFATAFRPAFQKMAPEVWQAEINKTPLKRRAEYKRSVIEHGLDSEFVIEALEHHRKLLSWMADSLKGGPYLAGDAFSNADCAAIPYILRLELLRLSGIWERYPTIAEWWARMRTRPSVKAAIFDRMTEADAAPFKNLAPDPWPKVQGLLKNAA